MHFAGLGNPSVPIAEAGSVPCLVKVGLVQGSKGSPLINSSQLQGRGSTTLVIATAKAVKHRDCGVLPKQVLGHPASLVFLLSVVKVRL